jgi:hypothetical protein
MDVILLTQPHCGFCDDVKAVLARLADDYDVTVTEQSLLDRDGRALADRLGVLFAPGILIDGDLVAYGRPSERRLRRELDRRHATRRIA